MQWKKVSTSTLNSRKLAKLLSTLQIHLQAVYILWLYIFWRNCNLLLICQTCVFSIFRKMDIIFEINSNLFRNGWFFKENALGCNLSFMIHSVMISLKKCFFFNSHSLLLSHKILKKNLHGFGCPILTFVGHLKLRNTLKFF